MKIDEIRGIQIVSDNAVTLHGDQCVSYLKGFKEMTVDFGKYNTILTEDDIIKAVKNKLDDLSQYKEVMT